MAALFVKWSGNRELVEWSWFDLNTFSFRHTDHPSKWIECVNTAALLASNSRNHIFGRFFFRCRKSLRTRAEESR